MIASPWEAQSSDPPVIGSNHSNHPLPFRITPYSHVRKIRPETIRQIEIARPLCKRFS